MTYILFNVTGTNNFIVPAAVKQIEVSCWAAGGGGGSTGTNIFANDADGDGGGGGGFFYESGISVTAGDTVNVYLGVGGSADSDGGDTHIDGSHYIAKGGTAGGYNSNNGIGGYITGTGGTLIAAYTGGDGGIDFVGGGGGGGAAGSLGDGSAGQSGSGTGTGGNGGNTAGDSAGQGGDGGDRGGNNGDNGNSYGGGGGGAGSDSGGDSGDGTSHSGGVGADGAALVGWQTGYLEFDSTPADTRAGATIPSFQVKIHFGDDGTIDTNYNNDITIAIYNDASGGTATLSGTLTVTAVAGVATFTGLSINYLGIGYTLVATAAAADLIQAISSSFTIKADRLKFAVQPSNAVNGVAISPSIVIYAVDVRDSNSFVDAVSSDSVSLTIANNPGGSTLSGTNPRTCSAGVATFNDISLNHAGTGYTLTASATGLTSATSAAFDITAGSNTWQGNSSIEAIAKIRDSVKITISNKSSSINIAKLYVKNAGTILGQSSVITINKINNKIIGTLRPYARIEARCIITDKPKVTMLNKSSVIDSAKLYDLAGLTIKNKSSIIDIAKIYDLSLLSRDPFTIFCNLYMRGSTVGSGTMPLYTQSANFASGLVNLYQAGPAAGAMNLFIRGLLGGSGSDSVDLSMLGTTNPGLFGTVPLFLGYELGFPDPHNRLNLYQSGPSSNSTSNSMNLFLENDNGINKNLNLFIENDYLQNSGTLELFTCSPSGTEGAVPYSGSMNMYIARTSEGISGGVNLFLKVNERVSGDIVTLNISGANSSTNSFNFYTYGRDTINYSGLNLYGQGF